METQSLSTEFLSDIANINTTITEFGYIFSTDMQSVSTNIDKVLSGELTPNKVKVQTISRGNLILEILDKNLYNNSYVGLFYKVGSEYKKLLDSYVYFELNSFLGVRRNVFLVKLENKTVLAKFDLDESKVIIRHPHDLESNSLANKSYVKDEIIPYHSTPMNVSGLRLTQGTTSKSHEEYYSLGHGYILNLMRAILKSDSNFSNVKLILLDSNFDSNNLPKYVNETYFNCLIRKLNNQRPNIVYCVKLKLGNPNGFYVRLRVKGGSHGDTINDEIIITPNTAISGTTQFNYGIKSVDNDSYLFINIGTYSLVEVESIGISEILTDEIQIDLTSSTVISDGKYGFIYPRLNDTSITESDLIDLSELSKYMIPYTEFLAKKSSVYSAINKSRYIILTSSDLQVEPSDYFSLVSVSSSQLLTAMTRSGIPTSYLGPISIICDNQVRSAGYRIQLELPQSLTNKEITIVANYGSMFDVSYNGNHLYVRNSTIKFIYNNGFDIIERSDSAIIPATISDGGLPNTYNVVGILPDLSKYYLELNVSSTFKENKNAGVYGGVPTNVNYVYDVDQIHGIAINIHYRFELPKLGTVGAVFGYDSHTVLFTESSSKFNGIQMYEVSSLSSTLQLNKLSYFGLT